MSFHQASMEEAVFPTFPTFIQIFLEVNIGLTFINSLYVFSKQTSTVDAWHPLLCTISFSLRECLLTIYWLHLCVVATS